jgi:peptide/nickel transport system permease protein
MVILKNIINFWNRYKKNRAAVIGLGIFIFFLFLAIFAPYLSPYNPYKMDLTGTLLPPGTEGHLFGTDMFGRDLLSRLIWGTRVSLFIGFVSAFLAQLIGIPLGAIAGFFGGRVDEIIMRFIDVFLVIPRFFLIILIVSVWGSSMLNVMLVIGFTSWPGTARLIRAEFLSIKERMYVEAAESVGASKWYIIFQEILPNAIYASIVNTSMQVAGAIMTEASLSFLGLGDPNNVSWGWMLNDARKTFKIAWWTSVFPGIFILFVSLAFNVIGDGLNDALNPHLKERK